tara:strand:- start:174489 stop:174656 length:168 start_codon:yes stop_codon:yes gene_type:complete
LSDFQKITSSTNAKHPIKLTQEPLDCVNQLSENWLPFTFDASDLFLQFFAFEQTL